MNTRTLFILDGSQTMREFSGFHIDCDLHVPVSSNPGIKAGSGGPRTVGKSFWTCNCEATLEFCRVIFDIFGDDRKVALSVAEGDSITPMILKDCSTLWEDSLVSATQYVDALFPYTRKLFELEQKKTPKSIKHGAVLKNAISLLSEGRSNENDVGGRIIYLTRLSSNTAVERLKNDLIETYKEFGDNWPFTSGCSITIVHTNAVGAEPKMFSCFPIDLVPGANFILEVTSAFSGKALTTCLYSLAMKHHGLVLTSIQGIPMKEEQGAGQSANYDVELLHPASVYDCLSALPDFKNFIGTSIREGVPLKIACMRWSTPKLSPSHDAQFRLHSFCASPLDLTSKPTQCLIQFLLKGRTVVLEPPTSTKSFTYCMMSVDGEIYLQAISSVKLPSDEVFEYTNIADKVFFVIKFSRLSYAIIIYP